MGTVVKQADTVLAGYPLMYPMAASTRAQVTIPHVSRHVSRVPCQDLATYEAATDPGGPAMTWGMFAIGQLELGRGDTAAPLFSRSYEPYVHPPFYMWTGETLTSDSRPLSNVWLSLAFDHARHYSERHRYYNLSLCLKDLNKASKHCPTTLTGL